MGIYLRADCEYYHYGFTIKEQPKRLTGCLQTSDKRLAKLRFENIKNQALKVKDGFAREKLPLSEIFDYYVKEHVDHNFDKNGRIQCRRILDDFLNHTKSPDAHDVTLDHVRNWTNKLKAGGLGKTSIDRWVTYIRAAYNIRIDAGVKIHNPTKGYEYASLVEKRNRCVADVTILTPADIALFLKNYCDEDLAEYLNFFYVSGLRPSEVMKVRASDLIPAECQFKTKRGKGGQDSLASVPADVMASLVRRAAKAFPNGYLFGEDGKKASTSFYRKRFEKARDAYVAAEKKPYFTPYDLRHSYSNYLLEVAGYDLKTAAVMMGHATVRMLDDYYSHISDARKRAVLKNLPKDLLAGVKNRYASAPEQIVDDSEKSNSI